MGSPLVTIEMMTGLSPAAIAALTGAALPDAAAHARATALLREWLTPEQLRQFDADGCFEVVGCDSGLRYRLKHGRVDALDREGATIFSLCFHPGGQFASGDVMLAQKIALESDENATLAVTNFIPRRRFGG